MTYGFQARNKTSYTSLAYTLCLKRNYVVWFVLYVKKNCVHVNISFIPEVAIFEFPAATPLQDFTIEEITEERASKCLSRIDLLNKIRNEILPHPDIDERLTKCRPSMELPDWWQLGRHDKDLIIGVCRSVWPPIYPCLFQRRWWKMQLYDFW